AVGDWDLDEERRALGLARAGAVALDPDAAVEAAHELAADVEAEAGAADAARHVRVEPVELLEDPPALGRRDAEALVRDGPAHTTLAAEDLHLDRSSVRRVLDRVLDEVDQHLAQLLLVRRHRGEASRGIERERDALGKVRARRVDHRLGDLGGVDRRGPDLPLAGVAV